MASSYDPEIQFACYSVKLRKDNLRFGPGKVQIFYGEGRFLSFSYIDLVSLYLFLIENRDLINDQVEKEKDIIKNMKELYI